MRKNKGIIGFFKGFKYAFKGIVTTLKSERNMRIHLGVGLNVLIFALFIGVSMTEYAVLLLTVSLVMSLEAVNSAIENLADRVNPEKDELIGKVKDISAGAVLISAIFSVIIAFCILFKPIEIAGLFAVILSSPLYSVLFILLELILILFIIMPERKAKK